MPDTPATPGPPPGWYADSPGAARLRWWNGSTWTDHYTERTPAPTAPPAPAAKPEPEPTEWMPDLVLTREPRGADRMPRPVTFTPNTSTGSSPWSPAPQGTFPASRGNPAATLSLALIVLALVGGIATFWWLDAAYPRIAELTRVAVAVVAIAAMLLAVVAVAVAPRRNAHLAPAVIALVVSVLLVVALIAWFVLRLLGPGRIT
ncbi:DUF2510 domain-containing protein [Microbacterium sp.]|uniref:DUF2510 domain-containing protein n=1 Tax=Microbacterium sp. TaxID=51671 RepID=UPI0037C83A3E